MAWIESHQSLLNHRKTGRLARALGISKVTAVGHLHAFWWWCMDNAQAGDLTHIDAEDVADGAAWEGDARQFVDALIYAGFVDRGDEQTVVHDWMDYAGKLIEKREKDAERKRAARLVDAQAPSPEPPKPVRRTSTGRPKDGAGTVPNRTVPNPTKEESVVKGEVQEGDDGADAPTPPDAPIPIGTATKSDRGSRIPRDFPLTTAMRQWAEEKTPELDLEYAHEEFCTYWRGAGTKRLDWEQTWQNGMLKAYDRVRQRTARLTVLPHNHPAVAAQRRVYD